MSKEGQPTAGKISLAQYFAALGELFCRQGRFKDARHMHEQELMWLEQVHGKESRTLVPTLLNIADACRSYGRGPTANQHEQRAMRLIRMNLGVDVADDAALLDAYARVLLSESQLHLAIQMNVRAHAIRCR